MTYIMSEAPGCFGSPTAFTPKTNECAICEFSEECCSKALETLERIEKELEMGKTNELRRKLTGDTSRRRRATPKRVVGRPAPAPVVGLPKKAGELVGKMQRFNFNPRQSLIKGENCFDGKKPAFLKVVGDLLIDGGFSKHELCHAFETELGWHRGSASSHVSLSIPALIHMEIIEENAGRYQLRRG